jgi:hypothetical protein
MACRVSTDGAGLSISVPARTSDDGKNQKNEYQRLKKVMNCRVKRKGVKT